MRSAEHTHGPALRVSALPHGELSLSDRLALAFIVAAALVTMALHPWPAPHVCLLLLQGLAIALVAKWGARSALGRHVHAFFPVVVVLGLFELLGPIIAAINPLRVDAALARADARLFGSLVDAWRNALGRPDWLTDLASLAYLSFYPLPVVVAAVLYRRPGRAEFDLFSGCVVATFLASYVGYFLWPALGPRVRDPSVLGGGATSECVRAFLHTVEGNQFDAFPSGHAAVATVTLLLAWPRFPRARPAVSLVVCGILFATVYLCLHYVVDLVAGVALGVVVTVAVIRHVRVRPEPCLHPQSASRTIRSTST